MKIEYSDSLGTTPARVYHDTGVIVLNALKWPQIPNAQRKFILLHELGHYFGETDSEDFADRFAFTAMAGTEKNSLLNTVLSLTDNLSNSLQHRVRSLNVYKNALLFDFKQNNNANALDEIKLIETELKTMVNYTPIGARKIYESVIPTFTPTHGNRFRDQENASIDYTEIDKQIDALLKISGNEIDRILSQAGISNQTENDMNRGFELETGMGNTVFISVTDVLLIGVLILLFILLIK